MSNHLLHILKAWQQRKDDCNWVLATVYKTQGSAYRKAGSYMLFNDLGERLGLLSGGCLESDLHRKALFAISVNQALTVQYDTTEGDNTLYDMGIGCGGIVDILLQPITLDNSYLYLDDVLEGLKQSKRVIYQQAIPNKKQDKPIATIIGYEDNEVINGFASSAFISVKSTKKYLITNIKPSPTLLVLGGGVDARPLVLIASQLGWTIILVDPRPANARVENFPGATIIDKSKIDSIAGKPWFSSINAAVIMCHNVSLDAECLDVLRNKKLDYCALLGPGHRQQKVLLKAKLTLQDLAFELFGPAGLDIGADLPESIALSILSECHAAFRNRDANSLSRMIKKQ